MDDFIQNGDTFESAARSVSLKPLAVRGVEILAGFKPIPAGKETPRRYFGEKPMFDDWPVRTGLLSVFVTLTLATDRSMRTVHPKSGALTERRMHHLTHLTADGRHYTITLLNTRRESNGALAVKYTSSALILLADGMDAKPGELVAGARNGFYYRGMWHNAYQDRWKVEDGTLPKEFLVHTFRDAGPQGVRSAFDHYLDCWSREI